MAPEALEGMHILDLGSGSGQDCFVLSKLVGENGHVTGVDMTKEQVCLAGFVILLVTNFLYPPWSNVYEICKSEIGILCIAINPV